MPIVLALHSVILCDEEITRRTRDEVASGKADGPYTFEEMDMRMGGVWTPVRRVGLVQPSGIRPIDDFSEFGHNGTSRAFEGELGFIDARDSRAF